MYIEIEREREMYITVHTASTNYPRKFHFSAIYKQSAQTYDDCTQRQGKQYVHK